MNTRYFLIKLKVLYKKKKNNISLCHFLYYPFTITFLHKLVEPLMREALTFDYY